MTTLPCDLPRYIFLFFAGIYASGLIGLPWDVLVLWATKTLPDNSPILRDAYFQVAVFGFLVINIWLILVADKVVEAIILYQLIDRNLIFKAFKDWNYQWEWYEDIRYILRNAVLYSFATDYLLIPQFVQLMSTASYAYFMYQNQLGV